MEENARLSLRSRAPSAPGLVVMRTKAGEGGGAPGEGSLFGWGQRGSCVALLLEKNSLGAFYTGIYLINVPLRCYPS